MAPLVVYLARDAAAGVNGQVFHSFGYGYTLLAAAARRPPRGGRTGSSDPAELAKLFPQTLGASLRQPPATDFGRTLGDRPAAEWKDLGSGVRFWQFPKEDR